MALVLGAAALAFVVLFGAGFVWARALLPRAGSADHVALSVLCSTIAFALVAATAIVAPWSFAAHSTVGAGLYVVGAVVLAVRRPGVPRELFGQRVLWAPFALGFAFVTLFGLVQGDQPGTVSWPGTFYSARVANLPADHVLPYRSAQYIQTRTDPQTRPFFPGWSLWDRTPLSALVASSAGAAVGVDYPITEIWAAWKVDQTPRRVDDSGFWFFHVVATLLNSAALLGIVRLALSYFGRRAALLAGLLAAATPYMLVHTFFTWPKMLAAYFVLLHFTYWRERRLPALVGGCAGLAYLSHPVGILYVAGTLGVGGLRRMKGAFLAVGAACVVVLPWQLWTTLYGAPSRMLTYPLGEAMKDPHADLGGDVATAWDNFRMKGPGAALDVRLDTFVQTFLPPPAPPDWTWESAWYSAHDRQLTGIVLLALLPAVLVGLVGWFRRYALEAVLFLVVPFVVILTYWGVAARGLGADCFQPMAGVLFVVGATGLLAWPAGWRLALAAVGVVESASVIWLVIYTRAPYAAPLLGAVAALPWIVTAAGVVATVSWRCGESGVTRAVRSLVTGLLGRRRPAAVS